MLEWSSCPKESGLHGKQEKILKKSEKSCEKCLTRKKLLCYNSKAHSARAGQRRTVVRLTQIKNRIRKKRFFVTQKAVSVNFFEQTNSTQNKVSKDNENLFKLEPSVHLAASALSN